MNTRLVCYINGQKIVKENVRPETTLLQFLRQELCLSGTKLACGDGGCGSCTVMVSSYNPSSKLIRHYSVNACLMPLVAVHGLAVTTVEGIGSTKTKLHPVQERLAKAYGTQCGFCSPGFVMSMYTLLRNYPEPSMAQIETAFQGNLCRCTGYRAILAGFRSFSKEWRCQEGENCCQIQNLSVDGDIKVCSKTFDASEFAVYDPTQDPIFPSELQLDATFQTQSLCFKSQNVDWYRPRHLDEVSQLKQQYPDAVYTVGATSIGKYIRNSQSKIVVICLTNVEGLDNITTTDTCIKAGATVTLASLFEYIEMQASKSEGNQKAGFECFLDMLHQVGGHQLRNVASIGSNIASGGPTSDICTMMTAIGATVDVYNVLDKSTKTKDVFGLHKEDGKSSLEPHELISGVYIPYMKQNEYVYWHKHAERTDLASATVNSAMKVKFNPDTNSIKDLVLCYGGIDNKSVIATQVREKTREKEWTQDLVSFVCGLLGDDLDVTWSSVGGSTNYKRSLTANIFLKFFIKVQSSLQNAESEIIHDFSSVRHKPLSSGSQIFETLPMGQNGIDYVGQPVLHKSAYQQATGEAVFCDDIPTYNNELHIALVTGTKAHAKILSIDASKAENMPGVKGFLSYKDIPNPVNIPRTTTTEGIFANEKVLYHGHAIGAIVADTLEQAVAARQHVHVEYEDLPAVIKLETAIREKRYLPNPKVLEVGDIEAGFKEADLVFEGHISMGSQEHFYMEPNSCIAVPIGEAGEVDITTATQSLNTAQESISQMLGVPKNRVRCHVKRIGGGFGGKGMCAEKFSTVAALAATKFNRPARLILDRQTDMCATGKRSRMYAKYKVGCSNEGKILAHEIEVYEDGGFFGSFLEFGMDFQLLVLICEQGYSFNNVKVTGFTCETNTQFGAAVRGYITIPPLVITQALVNDVAFRLGLPIEQVHKINMLKHGDQTPLGRELPDAHTLHTCWQRCWESSNYVEKKKMVEEFNKKSKWNKRGLYIAPITRNVGSPVYAWSQGAALVNIYTDGSVWVNHGGIEMGQGLHTKLIQVASKVLEVPQDVIHITETTTDCVPNAMPTIESMGTDLFGMAVKRACEKLVTRLAPYEASNPNGKWKDWVLAAYNDCTSLSATGFYHHPKENNWELEKPREGNFNIYYTYGAVAVEVEIDCLTGAHRVIQVDGVMDFGRSLNPTIDIGQMEGAFMMGYGCFVSEQIVYDDEGRLLTNDATTYKIPGVRDIPTKFNMQILTSHSDEAVLYGSKGVGEPPLHMSIAVMFAIKDAIAAARKDAGIEEPFQLNSPANAEQIHTLCSTKII
ncbi:unnamed protein product [Owenia fusiformis]|uniref:Xanthine dehydrogenase n=1 Tax=Owenia fusiformis TaxID=6347 RepID=A0A8S4PF49_OWEFU|nr:unnamed protein product [Owenia fusiformis]